MKKINLHSIKNCCERFWFAPNVIKLRIALMNYFRQEGIKCKLKDSQVNFDYDKYEFDAEFKVFDGFTECIIESIYEDDDYEKLDVKEKTFIADKVNTEEVNHCVTRAYNNTVEVHTSFYFTNTEMMLTIFCDRLSELVSSLKQLDKVLKDKKDDYKAFKSQRVGFYIETDDCEEDEDDDDEESEEDDDFEIAAKAK